MILSTCITTDTDNYVVISETTDGEQYLPEGSSLTAKNRFEYADTASVDIFKLNATSGERYSTSVIVDRSKDSGDARIKLDRDGWFTSIHMVIPLQQWVYKELSKSGSIINTYDIVYFTNGSDIYTCNDGVISRSSMDELLNETSTNTTISRVDTDYVSINILEQKYSNLYKNLFENRMYNGGCKTDACEANRLVAALNLVRHYVRWGQLAEAERIIEKINFFAEAKEIKKKKDKKRTNDCGCL